MENASWSFVTHLTIVTSTISKVPSFLFASNCQITSFLFCCERSYTPGHISSPPSFTDDSPQTYFIASGILFSQFSYSWFWIVSRDSINAQNKMMDRGFTSRFLDNCYRSPLWFSSASANVYLSFRLIRPQSRICPYLNGSFLSLSYFKHCPTLCLLKDNWRDRKATSW